MYFYLEHTGSLSKFLHSFIFLFFTCDLLTCPICQHSSLLTLSCLCFYLFFITPPYSSVLSPSSSFFIPPLLVFFPGLISLLSPLDHGPPHTAIMQLDREIVWLLKCVCVRKCETLCSQNRQSGPLSYTAHALMCKPLVTVLLPEGTPGATRVTWLCVCVFSGVGRWGSSLNAYPGITSWQEEWEVSSQTGCIKASLEASCGCLCQTEGGTVLIQPALPRGRDTVVTDLTYPTVHTVISMVNKSAEILSFPSEVSGKCVHCHCLSTANELCSSLKLQRGKEACYKRSEAPGSLQLLSECLQKLRHG